jgi:hypothetical protein
MLRTPKDSKPSQDSGPCERREGVRLDKVFPVYLEGDRGIGMGIARNISAGGLFVETRAPQAIGTSATCSAGPRILPAVR